MFEISTKSLLRICALNARMPPLLEPISILILSEFILEKNRFIVKNALTNAVQNWTSLGISLPSTKKTNTRNVSTAHGQVLVLISWSSILEMFIDSVKRCGQAYLRK